MVMKYILIRKNVKENQYYLSRVFEAELKEVFSNLSNKTFELELAGKTYILDYKFSNKQNSVYHLYIEFHSSPAIEAEVLNEVSKILSGSEIRKKHNLIVAYDEVSEYYCGKISPKFGKSERLLRELIFLIMIKTFGAKWSKKTIAKEMLDDVKESAGGMSETQVIETALYEMTISQLEDYLFKPYSELEKNPDLEEEFNKVDINQLTEEESINWLKAMQKRSLWDDYFVGYDLAMENIQQDLEIIRKYRNRVAHNKRFTKEDYDYIRRILNKFNRKMASAINNIEERDFAKIDLSVSYRNSLNMISRMMSMVSDEMRERLGELSRNMSENIKEVAKSFSNSVDSLIPMSTLNTMRQIQEQNAEMLKQLSQVGLKFMEQNEATLTEDDDDEKIDKGSEE